MTTKRFQVCFTGDIEIGFSINEVKKNLTVLFKGDKKKAALFFAEGKKVIKKGVDFETAEKYQQKFKQMGAICQIEALNTKDQPPQNLPPKETMVCPKCGFEQEKKPECMRCGIIIEKFLESPDLSDRKEVQSREPDLQYEPEESSSIVDGLRKKNALHVTFLISVILLILALPLKDRLPPAEKVLDELRQNPVQTQTDVAAFTAKVKGKDYRIHPLYDYELWGLVVSYYDTTGWWDITHKFMWKDNLNVKDICVVFGSNIVREAYREMSFKSGSWTCWPKTKTQKAARKFCEICLSNNHLLSDSRALNKAILKAKKGDQIYLKGYLAEYSHSNGSFRRGTSTTRVDSGNGACETIYLEDFRILKRANLFWRYLFSLSAVVTAGCLIYYILMLSKDYLRSSTASKKKIENRLAGGNEKLSLHDISEIASPKSYTTDKAALKSKLKVIGQLVFLLVLLYLWYRVKH